MWHWGSADLPFLDPRKTPRRWSAARRRTWRGSEQFQWNGRWRSLKYSGNMGTLGIWWNLVKSVEIWWNLVKSVEIWWNLVKPNPPKDVPWWALIMFVNETPVHLSSANSQEQHHQVWCGFGFAEPAILAEAWWMLMMLRWFQWCFVIQRACWHIQLGHTLVKKKSGGYPATEIGMTASRMPWFTSPFKIPSFLSTSDVPLSEKFFAVLVACSSSFILGWPLGNESLEQTGHLSMGSTTLCQSLNCIDRQVLPHANNISLLGRETCQKLNSLLLVFDAEHHSSYNLFHRVPLYFDLNQNFPAASRLVCGDSTDSWLVRWGRNSCRGTSGS